MRKFKSVFIILFALLFLSACNGKTVFENESVLTQTSETTSSKEETIPDVEDDGLGKNDFAVIPEKVDVGKKIYVSGELEKEQYADEILKLEEVLNAYSYNISLTVSAVDGSKYLCYNTNEGIFGACTVKAAYSLYACLQTEQGNGDLQTMLTYQEKHYEPGTGDMQYSPFGTQFTVATALNKSMSISDNVGYMMLVDYFGRDGYNAFVKKLGCESLVIKPTVWSLKTRSDDLVKIWCEIYNYFKTDTEYSRFLYESCTNTANNYLTASLKNIDYSHKQGSNRTGDWLSYSDAGIVWKGETPYIIAVLTDAPGASNYNSETFSQIINIVHNSLF